ncbi:MAG: type II toxin-antitoxin system VapC family toxin [Acidimicrobiia bacterium]
MILVDSNIPMYLVGSSSSYKSNAHRLLEELISDNSRLVTDAEVLQEILHRYRAIDRAKAIQSAFDAVLNIVDEVFPVDRADVELARDILLARWHLSARDALHVAVMQRQGVKRILSFDAGFDEVPGITRIH